MGLWLFRTAPLNICSVLFSLRFFIRLHFIFIYSIHSYYLLTIKLICNMFRSNFQHSYEHEARKQLHSDALWLSGETVLAELIGWLDVSHASLFVANKYFCVPRVNTRARTGKKSNTVCSCFIFSREKKINVFNCRCSLLQFESFSRSLFSRLHLCCFVVMTVKCMHLTFCQRSS